MAMFETWLKNDLAKPINVVPLHGVLFNLDNLANKIGVEVENNGQPAVLEGTVAGYVIRNDGTTLNLTTNTGKDGNKAWVILPQEAYTVEGPISIVIKLVYNSAATTIGACSGYVTRSRTSSEIAPTGTVIPSLASLEAAIAAANTAAANAAEATDYIAPTEEDSTANAAYSVGMCFIYNGKMMIATSAIAQGATIVPYASGVTNYNCKEVPNGLSGDVYDVKHEITRGNNRNILFDTVTDSYITFSGVITAYVGWERSDYIACSDYFALKINAPSSSQYNAFYTSEKVFISKFTTYAGDNLIYVPSNAAYFIVASKKERIAVTTILPITKAEYDATHALPALESFTGFTAISGWSAPSRDIYILSGTTATLSQASTISDWQYVVVPCIPGDEFVINGTGASGPRAWAFTDSEYGILAVEEAATSVVDKKLVAPSGSAYMILNRRATLCDRPSYIVPSDSLGNIIEDYNSTVIFEDKRTGEYTYGGVTYTITNGIAHIQGETGNSMSVLNLYSMQTSLDNNWIIGDHNYYMEVHRSADDKAHVRVVTFIDNQQIDLYKFYESGTFKLHRASELTHLYIRYAVPKNSVVNNTISFRLFSAPTNSELLDYSKNSGLIKLRVIQNNIGCFRYGRTPGTLELTDEEYAIKLANYKRFYGDLKPDVLCLQEYVRYIGDGVNDANTVLYGPIFRNTSADLTITSKQNVVFTNLEAQATNKSVSVTVDNQTVTFKYAEMILNRIGVKVLSFALKPNGTNVDNENVRVAEFGRLMELLEDDNNVIICADMNVYSDEQLETLLEMAAQNGFHSFANGGYWGTYDTYIDPANQSPLLSYYRRIDNILVKGNIKMVNAKSLLDESTDFPDDFVFDPADDSTPNKSKTMVANSPYNHLASDHIPIMADLVVY